MTHRDAINAAMGHVMWARRHLIPLRATSETADAALDALDTCMDELREALRPSPWPGAGKLIRALPTTLRELSRRLATIEGPGATEARRELREAVAQLESDDIEWARID